MYLHGMVPMHAEIFIFNRSSSLFHFVIVSFLLLVSPVLYVINLTYELRLNTYLKAKNNRRGIGWSMKQYNVLRWRSLSLRM